MNPIQLTQIIQPINSSVKPFSWERFYIATWSLNWSNINFEKAEKVDYENKPSRANQEVKVWDVIFAKMQNTKKTLLITEKETEFIFSSWFFVLRTNEEILSEYLYHFLNSSFFLDQKDRNCTWATQKALTLDWLKKIFIPLPSIQSQKEIVNKLDKLSELISLRKESIKKQEDLTKSIFIEMFGDPMLNEKGWGVKCVEALSKNIKNGITRRWDFSDNWNIVLRLRDIKENQIDYSDVYKIELTKNETKLFELTNNNIVFIRVNWNPDYVWRCAVFYRLNEKVFFNDHIMRIELNLDIVSPIFLSRLLNSSYWKWEIKKYLKTSAWQYTINQNWLNNIKLPLPPISLQNKFAEIVQKNEENIKKQKESLEKFEELYSATMQESFRF